MTGSIGDTSYAGALDDPGRPTLAPPVPAPPARRPGASPVPPAPRAAPVVPPPPEATVTGITVTPHAADSPHVAPSKRRLIVRAPRSVPNDRVQKSVRLAASDRDASTGLVSRGVLLGELEHALSAGRPAALLAVGLDWGGGTGQNIGDEELVAAVAHRVSTAVRSGDPVASFGADGLFVLIEDVPHREVAISIARRLVAAASGPVSLRGRSIEATAGVGVVLTAEAGGASADDIVRAAAHGRHQARALGGDRVEIVSAVGDADDTRRARQWPKRELERAVQNAEFVAYYQPVVAVTNADLIGFEALMRWEHPQLGLLTPPAFVGAAESTGLLVRIGTEIMRQSLRQLGRWIDRLGDRPLSMAINFSSRQLAALDFVDTVVDLVRASGIPPGQVVLEIGEASLAVDDAQMAGTLGRLREEHILLSLDDFGSGTASFEALGRVPFDVVKLDRKIVSAMNEPTGAAVAHAMVQLGHSLGKTVVAEGVETARELAMLRQMECDQAQGHLFSKPKPAAVIDTLLDRWVSPAT